MSLEAEDAKWHGTRRPVNVAWDTLAGESMLRSLSLGAVVALAGFLAGPAPADEIDDGLPVHNPGIASQHDSDGLPFLSKLRWKMRREQIQLAYPEVQDTWITRGFSERPNFRELKIPHVAIEGCRFQLSLGFFNPPEDTLTEIVGVYDGPDVEDCLQRVRTKFFDTFGLHPWNSGEETGVVAGTGERTETAVSRAWLGKVTTITFEVTTMPKTGKHRFRFVLQHTGAPGTYVE
jgi:hypothetical protein